VRDVTEDRDGLLGVVALAAEWCERLRRLSASEHSEELRSASHGAEQLWRGLAFYLLESPGADGQVLDAWEIRPCSTGSATFEWTRTADGRVRCTIREEVEARRLAVTTGVAHVVSWPGWETAGMAVCGQRMQRAVTYPNPQALRRALPAVSICRRCLPSGA
jgi:hypothetical protein